jgi:hypothetical protein
VPAELGRFRGSGGVEEPLTLQVVTECRWTGERGSQLDPLRCLGALRAVAALHFVDPASVLNVDAGNAYSMVSDI